MPGPLDELRAGAQDGRVYAVVAAPGRAERYYVLVPGAANGLDLDGDGLPDVVVTLAAAAAGSAQLANAAIEVPDPARWRGLRIGVHVSTRPVTDPAAAGAARSELAVGTSAAAWARRASEASMRSEALAGAGERAPAAALTFDVSAGELAASTGYVELAVSHTGPTPPPLAVTGGQFEDCAAKRVPAHPPLVAADPGATGALREREGWVPKGDAGEIFVADHATAARKLAFTVLVRERRKGADVASGGDGSTDTRLLLARLERPLRNAPADPPTLPAVAKPVAGRIQPGQYRYRYAWRTAASDGSSSTSPPSPPSEVVSLHAPAGVRVEALPNASDAVVLYRSRANEPHAWYEVASIAPDGSGQRVAFDDGHPDTADDPRLDPSRTALTLEASRSLDVGLRVDAKGARLPQSTLVAIDTAPRRATVVLLDSPPPGKLPIVFYSGGPSSLGAGELRRERTGAIEVGVSDLAGTPLAAGYRSARMLLRSLPGWLGLRVDLPRGLDRSWIEVLTDAGPAAAAESDPHAESAPSGSLQELAGCELLLAPEPPPPRPPLLPGMPAEQPKQPEVPVLFGPVQSLEVAITSLVWIAASGIQRARLTQGEPAQDAEPLKRAGGGAGWVVELVQNEREDFGAPRERSAPARSARVFIDRPARAGVPGLVLDARLVSHVPTRAGEPLVVDVRQPTPAPTPPWIEASESLALLLRGAVVRGLRVRVPSHAIQAATRETPARVDVVFDAGAQRLDFAPEGDIELELSATIAAQPIYLRAHASAFTATAASGFELGALGKRSPGLSGRASLGLTPRLGRVATRESPQVQLVSSRIDEERPPDGVDAFGLRVFELERLSLSTDPLAFEVKRGEVGSRSLRIAQDRHWRSRPERSPLLRIVLPDAPASLKGRFQSYPVLVELVADRPIRGGWLWSQSHHPELAVNAGVGDKFLRREAANGRTLGRGALAFDVVEIPSSFTFADLEDPTAPDPLTAGPSVPSTRVDPPNEQILIVPNRRGSKLKGLRLTVGERLELRRLLVAGFGHRHVGGRQDIWTRTEAALVSVTPAEPKGWAGPRGPAVVTLWRQEEQSGEEERDTQLAVDASFADVYADVDAYRARWQWLDGVENRFPPGGISWRELAWEAQAEIQLWDFGPATWRVNAYTDLIPWVETWPPDIRDQPGRWFLRSVRGALGTDVYLGNTPGTALASMRLYP